MATSQETEKRRKQLNIWLASKNMSRIELANLCNVSESTVYGWLSNTNISDKRWEQIKSYFEPPDKQDTEPVQSEKLRAIATIFNDELMERMKKAKEKIGCAEDSDFVHRATLKLIEDILKEQ